MSCLCVLMLPPAPDPAKAVMEPCMAALDLGLACLEREGAQRERDADRSRLVNLRSTAATSAGSD
jgi:hypothetical protein